jgi:hypothetical protein
MTVFVWAGTWAVNIEELDVSNGPESGRNLAVIVAPRTASLCQLRPFDLSGIDRYAGFADRPLSPKR